MSNLTIEQFCQLETLKSDLHLESSYRCEEKLKGNVTVLELTDSTGKVVQELIVVL